MKLKEDGPDSPPAANDSELARYSQQLAKRQRSDLRSSLIQNGILDESIALDNDEYDSTSPANESFGDGEVDGHLASFDVKLPMDQSGVEYFFTAPRSEIKISARPVTMDLVDRVSQMLLVGNAIVIVIAVRQFGCWFIQTGQNAPASA